MYDPADKCTYIVNKTGSIVETNGHVANRDLESGKQ